MLKGIGEEATYFYHPDHLGSVSVVSNHKGVPYERVEYLPFGEVWIEDVDPATRYIPFRFTSKELDRETGLYYYGARYYEPKVSRWMSADPAGWELINLMDEDGEPVPNGWPKGFGPGPSVGMRPGYSVIEATNWYAYVSNNPVKYVDPEGYFEVDYDEEGNATIQTEIENRSDIRKAISTFYAIEMALPEGDHRIQFIDRDGNISGDYSNYSDALDRFEEEWPSEIKLTPGFGLEVANIGIFLGVSDGGVDLSVSFLLISGSIGADYKGNLRKNADVDFTIIAGPGLKVDFSFTAMTKNMWRNGFNKVFGKRE